MPPISAPTHASTNARRKYAALFLMVLSGFAGLGYEIVWTQQCALSLGHEAAAVLAVMTAFFGGLALGAFTLGARIEASEWPLHWYLGSELVVAAWSTVLLFLMQPFSGWMLAVTGLHPHPLWQWTVTFCGTLVLLLPATMAMGASLPAMEKLIAEESNARRSIAPLYAANTAGAVLGVLLTAFWWVPAFGLTRTASLCIALNIVCGVICWFYFPRTPIVRSAVDAAARSTEPVLAMLAVTGLLGIGYEVLVIRVLSEVTENTVYTFALLLAIYLAGSALGAAAYRRLCQSRHAQALTQSHLLNALALACLFGTASLWATDALKSVVLKIFGAGMDAALAAEAILALVAFGLPTLAMGAVFSHLSDRANEAGYGFGHALAVNTAGAAAAPLIFGVLALPALGAKLALLAIVIGYLLLTGLQSWRRPPVWTLAGVVIALAFFAPRLAFIDLPEGGRVLDYQEGVMAAVSVTETADGVAVLRINNRQQEGSSATLRVDGRQAWLPLLLHPAPRQALFLGLGTGVTASAALADPQLAVDAVELLPEVIAASAYFRRPVSSDTSRLHLIAADARRYVQLSKQRYDVIVADNFHPARSGSGALYTVEHFAAVRHRLSDMGVFCQWLPLHQLDLDTLRSIVRSFMLVYPNGWAMLANNGLDTPVVGLIGRHDDARFNLAALDSRLKDMAVQATNFGIEDEFALLGSFIAGPEALRQFASTAPLNTDDHPIVAYRAPRITYVPDSSPRDRLIELLHKLSIAPDDLVAFDAQNTQAVRLAAYWHARNRFIEFGRNAHPSADVRALLAQVQGPLLSVLHVSPDFRPAYDPLLRMAMALANSNPSAAHDLLMKLAEVQPARPEAERALHTITDAR